MPIDRELQKAALKEALKEWLDEKAAEFGKTTFKWMVMAVFVGLVYLWLTSHGWTAPK